MKQLLRQCPGSRYLITRDRIGLCGNCVHSAKMTSDVANWKMTMSILQ